MAIKSGLGYSPLTDKVFYGRQNPDKRMWVGEKKDVTQDFMAVASEYFSVGTIRDISCSNGSNNLFLNVKNDEESIGKAIKYLNRLLEKNFKTSKK